MEMDEHQAKLLASMMKNSKAPSAVFQALATNPSLPHATLVGLASHKRRDVRKTALARLLEVGRAQQAAPAAAAPELRDRPSLPGTQAPPQNSGGGAW